VDSEPTGSVLSGAVKSAEFFLPLLSVQVFMPDD
jgi:hypothetical protein